MIQTMLAAIYTLITLPEKGCKAGMFHRENACGLQK
jgi:hypothetical protein